MIRCNPVEVLPRVSLTCTEEIPVTWNNTSLFVDPISYIIKPAGGGVSEVSELPRDPASLPHGDHEAGLWQMWRGWVLGPQTG
jgi:hypothetical protein